MPTFVLLAASEPPTSGWTVFTTIMAFVGTGLSVYFGVLLSAWSERMTSMQEKLLKLDHYATQAEQYRQLAFNLELKNAGRIRDIPLEDGFAVRVLFPSETNNDWKCAAALKNAINILQDQHFVNREPETEKETP